MDAFIVPQKKPVMDFGGNNIKIKSARMGQYGYTLVKKDVSAKVIEKCKQELTLVAGTGTAAAGPTLEKDKIRVYRENANKLYVPKFYGIEKFGPVPLPEVKNQWTTPVKFKGSLRPHQLEPVQKCLDTLRGPNTPGGLLQLFCGAGKTTCALYMICALKVKTLVIVHKEFLMTQWRDSIAKFIPEARIGKIQQNVQDVENKHIVLGMLKSIAMKDYPLSLFSQFDLIIIDECHFVCSKTFSNALFKLAGSRYTLGLSATPKRQDSMEKIFFWHLGPIIYAMKREKVECNVHVYNYQETKGKYTEQKNVRGDIQVSSMMTQVVSNGYRNYFIGKLILDTFAKDPRRKILVLSERRSHLQTVLECMKREKKKRDEVETSKAKMSLSCGFFYGGLSESERTKSAECDVILGTFQMASVGLDIAGLNTLVLVTSKPGITRNDKGEQISGSMEQSVGRIFRGGNGNNNGPVPLIIDVADKFSVFSNQAYKRIKFYKQCDYRIEAFKVRENMEKKCVEFI